MKGKLFSYWQKCNLKQVVKSAMHITQNMIAFEQNLAFSVCGPQRTYYKVRPTNSKILNNFKCVLTNVRSIGPKTLSGAAKRKEIELLCNKNKIDLLFVNKSWTCKLDTNASININGFQSIARVEKHSISSRGGRILIYAKNNISCVYDRDSYKGNDDLSIQMAHIEIRANNKINVTLMCLDGQSNTTKNIGKTANFPEEQNKNAIKPTLRIRMSN